MHGETHPVVLDGTVSGMQQDPWGNDRVGVELRGTISRGEFGLRWQQALETGGLLVGDEVRIAADISAIRTPTISCASSVDPPICGVASTASDPNSGKSAFTGSAANTSNAASATFPDSIAARSTRRQSAALASGRAAS